MRAQHIESQDKISRLPNTSSIEKWIDRISAAWREQVPSIFETGNLLEASQLELKETQPGGWSLMVKEKLPFSRITAFRLMAIAADDKLRNVTHVQHLPATWGTLYELTKLTPEQFEAGIASGAINPKMERKDVNALRGIEPKQKKKKEAAPKLQTLNDWVFHVHQQISAAGWALRPDERQEFFECMRQHLDNLERKLSEHREGQNGTGAA